mgnify:FL=1
MYQINQNCIVCGNCIAECPVGAIKEGDHYSIDTELCTDCGACTSECAADAIERVPEPSNTGQTEELEGFQDTGKYPPSQGDLIYLGNNGFGFVDNVIIDGSYCIVNFYATVYDYKYEGNSMAIKQPDAMQMSSSYLKKPTEAQMREFRKHLNEKNLTFDYGFKKVVNRAISRVEAGSQYYYIDTDMAERTAIDDGLDSGIHYARFKHGNYFKNKSRASLLGKEVRNILKNFIMPYGIWT